MKTSIPDHTSFNCIGCAITHDRYQPPGGIIEQTDTFLLHHDPEVLIPGFSIAYLTSSP